MRSGSFSKIVVVVVECAWLVGTTSQAGMAAEKNIFLVPVSQGTILEGIRLSGCDSGWPNDGNKVAVIALDAFGTIPKEVEDYLGTWNGTFSLVIIPAKMNH